MARLLSLNVGLPRDVPWQGKTVHTGIWKYPVTGPRMARRLNIDGDGQGDLAGHGGEQRAVMVYQRDSHEYWRRYLGRDDIGYGMFGENFTVDGLPDDKVCIGDRYRIGEAEFEVTQPRVTCYRVGMRLGVPEMPSLLVSHRRPGFYLRVITEGHVEAGDEIVQTATGPGRLSVTETDALLYLPGRDLDRARVALTIPALSPGWQSSFRDMVTPKPATPALPAPGWPGFRRLRVTRVTRESDTVSSIWLAATDGDLPAALPGQYLTLRVAGAGDPAPVRSYSLSSPPGAGYYRISVKREPHGVVSDYLHRQLRPDAVLDVAAPRGEFVLTHDDSPVLLVSAGIGVTPMMAMLHQLAAGHSTRDVWWIHGARNPAEHALAGEAHDLLGKLPHVHEHVFYSAATDAELAAAHATPGRISAEALRKLDVPTTATAYLCGPSAFMDATRDALTELGVAPSSVHTELFAALAAINPGVVGADRPAPHPPAGPLGTGPLVTFARSGLSVPYDTAQPSLLDMAEACDVPTRFACRTGVCHTCVTPLLSGAVAYSPDPLEPPADGDVLVCCSQPESDVVLDM
ncbi:MAG TPA: MOSC and FAD-binding oxidoreductase domain-containing protein [Pseudonocardiaceae bacterium]|nr:MOSC and FAD-binding oxidoreductase domain-containing protein [Pseudonocardiaceae bacterium]